MLEGNGLFKIKITEGEFGKVLLQNKKLANKYMLSIVYLNGKLYVKSRMEPTKNSSKQVVDFLVLDPNTL
jgi:hypothetical protein